MHNNLCIQGSCIKKKNDKTYLCGGRKCEGVCIDDVCNSAVRCISDDDCSSDQMCDTTANDVAYKTCIKKPCFSEGGCGELIFKKCRADEECPSGLVCKFGACLKGCSKKCKKCQHGTCTDNGKRCPKEITCSFGQICFKGSCQMLQCYETEDCAGDKHCLNGKCIETKVLTACNSDNYCPGNMKCINGKCYDIQLCKTNAECSDWQACDSTYRINGHMGICVQRIYCNRQEDPRNSGCPENMHCDRQNYCVAKECISCSMGQECTFVMDSSAKTCWPTKQCLSNDDCEEDKVCDQELGKCTEACGHCKEGYQCINNACQYLPHCYDDDDCLPRQFCSQGECVKDYGIGCYRHSDCADGGCFAGTCVVNCKDCETKRCNQNKQCLMGCKSDNNCEQNYMCQDKICIPIMRCMFDSNCPIDMKCRNKEDESCNGEKSCKCKPAPCSDCMYGCKDDTCQITPFKACEDCREGFICPDFDDEQYSKCHKVCRPYDKSSCSPDSLCVTDKTGKSVCIERKKCTMNSDCIRPLRCLDFQCARPGCFENDDCPYGHYCYAGICQKLIIHGSCESDIQCSSGTCIMIKNSKIGICQRCPEDCPPEDCKNGFCLDKRERCFEDHHCDQYSKCLKGLCVNRGCKDCQSGR